MNRDQRANLWIGVAIALGFLVWTLIIAPAIADLFRW